MKRTPGAPRDSRTLLTTQLRRLPRQNGPGVDLVGREHNRFDHRSSCFNRPVARLMSFPPQVLADDVVARIPEKGARAIRTGDATAAASSVSVPSDSHPRYKRPSCRCTGGGVPTRRFVGISGSWYAGLTRPGLGCIDRGACAHCSLGQRHEASDDAADEDDGHEVQNPPEPVRRSNQWRVARRPEGLCHPAANGVGWQYRLAVLCASCVTPYVTITWAASSVVEHLTFNQGVAGSIPARPTNGIKVFRISPLRLPPVIILTAAEYLALQPGSDWQPRWPSKLPTERERSVCARRHAHGEDLAFVDPRHGLGDLAHDHSIASFRPASPWRAAGRCFPWRWRSACRSGHGERPDA